MPLSLRERQLALLVALVRQRQRQEAEAAAPAHGGAAPAAAEQQAAEAQAAGLQAAHEQLLYYKQRVALLQAQCAEAGSPSPVPHCQPLALWLEGRDADSPAECVRSGLGLLGGLLLVEPSRDGAELALWNEPSGAVAAISRVTQRVLASAAAAQPAATAAQEAVLVLASRLCSSLTAPSSRLRLGSAARSGWLVAAQRCLELLGADPRIGERCANPHARSACACPQT